MLQLHLLPAYVWRSCLQQCSTGFQENRAIFDRGAGLCRILWHHDLSSAPSEEAALYHVFPAQGLEPPIWNRVHPIDDASKAACDRCSRICVIAEIHGSKHAIAIRAGIGEAPERRFLGIAHKSA